MSRSILKERYDAAVAAGLEEEYTLKATKWHEQLMKQQPIVTKAMMRSSEGDTYKVTRNRLFIGRMYMIFYDPKHKDTLPYYDKMPLILVIDRDRDSFLGVNMHYLSPIDRSLLLGEFFNTRPIAGGNDFHKRFLALDSGTLKRYRNHAVLRRYKPALKRYLVKHVAAPALQIPYKYWFVSLFIRTPLFESASLGRVSNKRVWLDSRKTYLKKTP